MGEILGVGVTHYPGLIQPDEQMAGLLNRTLNSDQVPEKLKEPKTWPAQMREEWKDPVASAKEHRKRLVNGFRKANKARENPSPACGRGWPSRSDGRVRVLSEYAPNE
jgi:hypothetical protein